MVADWDGEGELVGVLVSSPERSGVLVFVAVPVCVAVRVFVAVDVPVAVIVDVKVMLGDGDLLAVLDGVLLGLGTSLLITTASISISFPSEWMTWKS